MAKKKQTVADEAQQKEALRRSVIRDFNTQNFGTLWIDPDKIPTEDDVKAAKEEFETRTKALQTKNDYLIADAANALRVANFIKKFLKTCFWAQGYWRGVLNLNGYLDDFIKDFDEANPKPLVMEYGPMQFTYAIFENYAGLGLEAANEFALMWDEYVPIYDTLREHVEWVAAENKACEQLKDRWAMLEQGYYLVILPQDEAMAEAEAPAVSDSEATE